jgi:hypothetical protein
VSLNASLERAAIPSPVLDAAETGTGRARSEVDVPETPVRLRSGTYYRVYRAGRTDAPPTEHLAGGLLTFLAPVVGLGVLIAVAGRVDVTYVGDDLPR